MILSEKLIMLRKKNGWSQEELAMKMDISRQSVSKWESGASLPDLDKVIKLSHIFNVSTDFLLKDSIECEDVALDHEKLESEIKTVSLEEANVFMDLSAKMARRIATAVSMCIFSPIMLLLLGGLSEFGNGRISEDMAGGIGTVILLIIVGSAVGIMIINGMQLDKYHYLEVDIIELQYGVEGIVRKRKSDFEPTHRACVAIGVILCIMSVIPILVAAAFHAPELIYVYCVDLLLIIVGIGVYLFVWSGMIFGSFEKLLQEGEFTKEKKEENKRVAIVSVIYWCIITAIYLGISFYTMNWDRSWIIWPCAGVFFAAICGIVNLIHKAGDRSW